MSDHLVKYQYKKGDPRAKAPNGRPSKKTVKDICNDMGFCPIEFDVLIASDQWKMLGLKKEIPISIRQKSAQSLSNKIYPNLKAIELKEDLETLDEDRVVVILPSNDRELPSEVQRVEHEEVDTDLTIGEVVVETAKELKISLEDLDAED